MKKQKTRFYEADYADGRRIRVYENDGAYHSASYIEKPLRFLPVFRYMRAFNKAFDLKQDINTVLLIGGAGYGWPKYVLSTYPDISMDVVDIDSDAYENALEHFYLDELIRIYHPDLHPITDDGRHYLQTADKKYDLIVNDAYVGTTPVPSLLTLEACRDIHERLSHDGIYAANLHGYTRLKLSYDLLDAACTASEVFRYVSLVPIQSTFTGNYRINYVLFASDKYKDIPGSVEYSTKKCKILRD